nr:tyrosine-type recombinase/integrase [Occallatibacter savannae]
MRLGNWLSAEESKALWEAPDPNGLKGKRDRALFALLLACGLRRHEAVSLKLRDLEQREGRWAIVDLIGKGDHVRTVPIPDWVREQLESWIRAAGICEGLIFRRVNRSGQVRGEHISEKAIWHIVRKSARRAGLPNVAPHDLRRTCARLCQSAGGELEQIQFLLGHVSIQTTERYLGSKQRLRCAVNDRIGIEPKP